MEGTAAAVGATGVAARAPVLGAVGVAKARARRAWVPPAGTSDVTAVPGALRACMPSAGTWEEEALPDASTADVPAAFSYCDTGAVLEASTAGVPAALLPAAMTPLKARCDASAFARALATS